MTVEFWTNSNNRNPVGEFIEDLPDKAKKKIVRFLDLVGKYGKKMMHSGYMKKLKGYDNLYELRVLYSGIFYRILFTIIDAVCWLLHIFKKKAPNTPQKEIDIALGRKEQLELRLAVAK